MIRTPDWGPDILIKVLHDMDIACFKGLSQFMIRPRILECFMRPDYRSVFFQRTEMIFHSVHRRVFKLKRKLPSALRAVEMQATDCLLQDGIPALSKMQSFYSLVNINAES